MCHGYGAFARPIGRNSLSAIQQDQRPTRQQAIVLVMRRHVVFLPDIVDGSDVLAQASRKSMT